MSRPFCLIALCWILIALLTVPSAAQFGEWYDFDDLGSALQAPRAHVVLTAKFAQKYLVLRADVLSGWHLYSATQPAGGSLPSTFDFELSGTLLTPSEIRPTTAPHVNHSPYFSVHLEEHDDAVTWIFTFQEDLPPDAAIQGTLHGMVCQESDGVCIPITVPFNAVFDATLDIVPLLEQAAMVDEQFVFNTSPPSQPLVAEGEQDNFPPVEETVSGSTDEPKPSGIQGIVFDPQETVDVTNLLWALLFAFFGGFILNFMPCVLPVIGLKILSFFEQAGKSRTRAFMLNAWYAAGMLSVFLFLAFLSLGLSILFTFDLFGIIMACIVFVMALSLMNIWTLDVPGVLGGKASDQLTSQEGILGAFFKGIITTLLAIPCGAPLLSPAVNWADMQIRAGNMPEVFLMYGIIGLGMASPYLLLGAFPEWLRFLPKPGAWMETFKKTMGFCLLLAVVWILYFVPVEKVLPTVALLFGLWFVCWLFGEQQMSGQSQARTYIISPIVLAIIILFSYKIPGINNPYTLESAMHTRIYGHQGEHWTPYSRSAFDSALVSGRTVIIDFTADWCVNCKVLEATVLQSPAILTLLDDQQIVSLQADCTREGEAKELLSQLGPFIVPTLAIFDPAKPTEPTVIRGFYTQQSLADVLR